MEIQFENITFNVSRFVPQTPNWREGFTLYKVPLSVFRQYVQELNGDFKIINDLHYPRANTRTTKYKFQFTPANPFGCDNTIDDNFFYSSNTDAILFFLYWAFSSGEKFNIWTITTHEQWIWHDYFHATKHISSTGWDARLYVDGPEECEAFAFAYKKCKENNVLFPDGWWTHMIIRFSQRFGYVEEYKQLVSQLEELVKDES